MTFVERVVHEIKELGSVILIFAPIWLVVYTFLFELRSIPSESMVPNLLVGDRVAVSKFSYGYSKHSLPFGLGRALNLPDGRIMGGEPERGDVAVFHHPHLERTMIKRLIGLPGDRIQVLNNRVYLNGEFLELSPEKTVTYREARDGLRTIADELIETLPNGPSYPIHDIKRKPSANTLTFVVPEGHFFFMGDNRDNSADSRVVSGHCPEGDDGVISEAGCAPRSGYSEPTIGFVPYSNLVGKAETVFFTFNFCQKFESGCPKGRVWKSL